MSEQPGRRRRGKTLEDALLRAAWDELVETGYAALTMEGVAVRAGTSRAVLYRRWPGKSELVVAAIRHRRETAPVIAPDTGSLRGDLIALLRSSTRLRIDLAAMIGAQLGGLFAETGTTPAELRDSLLGERGSLWSAEVYRRAADRGELVPGSIPESVLAMPFDLLRHDMIMTFESVPDERVIGIVDELFLPLLARYQDG
ncbi:TetR/AcrR family transcriptional regulator [Actinomadura monticuli]|uniref:TetR/AcrR family transcriptional regulator n=1 Tax=Actinomadura monticuli TaxID=3097367 RepID=A0ABV4QFU3_9ACTN